MDGRWVPADVLFFYKTLPLRTAAHWRACHTCDEWPEGNIFTSDPEQRRACSHTGADVHKITHAVMHIQVGKHCLV